MTKITNYNHHEELYIVIDQILSVQFKIVGGRQRLLIGFGVTVKEAASGVVGVGGIKESFQKQSVSVFLALSFLSNQYKCKLVLSQGTCVSVMYLIQPQLPKLYRYVLVAMATKFPWRLVIV